MTDWTPQNDKALELRIRVALPNLEALRYRGCCMVCGSSVGHEATCAVLTVTNRLRQHQQEQRDFAQQKRCTAAVAARRAKSAAKVEAAWMQMKGIA